MGVNSYYAWNKKRQFSVTESTPEINHLNNWDFWYLKTPANLSVELLCYHASVCFPIKCRTKRWKTILVLTETKPSHIWQHFDESKCRTVSIFSFTTHFLVLQKNRVLYNNHSMFILGMYYFLHEVPWYKGVVNLYVTIFLMVPQWKLPII